MTNTNLIERLRYFSANGDHERGCQGREYSCTCRFDDNAVAAVNEAAATIEQQATLIESQRVLLARVEHPLSLCITLASKAGYDTTITSNLLQSVVKAAEI